MVLESNDRPLMFPVEATPTKIATFLRTDDCRIETMMCECVETAITMTTSLDLNVENVKIDKILEETEKRKDLLENGTMQRGANSPVDSSNGGLPCGNPFDQCTVKVCQLQHAVITSYTNNKATIHKVFYTSLSVLALVYVIFACIHDIKKALPLLVLAACVLLQLSYNLVNQRLSDADCTSCLRPIENYINKNWHIIKWPLYSAFPVGTIVFLLLDVGTDPRQYIPLCGLVTFLVFLYIFSANRSQVKARPIIWGFILQFTMAIVVLRTSWGFYFFRLIGIQSQKFLSYADVGSRFVFGDKFMDHPFAFQILPVIIYFSAMISVLYYAGIMHAVIGKLAWLMQHTMQTSATESLVAASNIFIGQTEAPILVKPYIHEMSLSELHAMMTAGYATIAGGVLAAYILFGVPAEHLICASVMNAPVSLAVSKLFYPETEKSHTRNNSVQLTKSTETNIIEAAASGASQAIPLVLNIAANLIAFLALLSFVNASLSWAGAMVGFPQFDFQPLSVNLVVWSLTLFSRLDHRSTTFQLICSYLFWPFALLMGVERKDCFMVAELLGTKTFLNEFVAYTELTRLAHNRRHCIQPYISERSEVVATYALCGFANLCSMGVQIGGIGAMAPSRAKDISKLAFRALVAGTLVCFITACVASVLTVIEDDTECYGNMTLVNATQMSDETTTTPSSPYTLMSLTSYPNHHRHWDNAPVS